jgi:hypothetical protein
MLRLAVGTPLCPLIRIPLHFAAIAVQHAFQPVLCTQVCSISFVGTVPLARRISLRVPIAVPVAASVIVPIAVALQTVQIIVGASCRAIHVRGTLESRHDWAIASEKSHSPAIMQKYNFSLNGTLR